MTKRTTFLILVTSVMMVGIPTYYYVRSGPKQMALRPAGSPDLLYDESGKIRSEEDIAAALKRKNRDLYLQMFRKTKSPGSKGEIYTYHTVADSPKSNSFHTYILKKDDNFSLHLSAQCTSRKGLALDHFNFSTDRDITEYYPTNSFVRDETRFGIIEKGDITVTYPEKIILSKILNAAVAKVKFVGAWDEVEIDLSEEDKHAIERTLTTFDELK